MNELHFTLGKDAGKLLAQVAQEHLLYNLDATKAIETFTKSFIGLPYDMAIKLLSGELVIEVEIDGATVNIVSRDENKHNDYPRENFSHWYNRKYKELRLSGDLIRQGLEEIRRSISHSHGVFEFEFDYTVIRKYISEKDISDIEDIIDSDPRVEDIRRMFRLADSYLKQTYKLFNVLDFLEKVYPDQINPFNGCVSGGRFTIVDDVAILLNSLVEYNYKEIEACIAAEDDSIQGYLKGAIEIAKILKSLIRPVNITDNYSAGWLSPDGKYYGLNGEISNMLHMNIADALRKKFRIEDGFEIGENPDSWLENNGWVKIHGSWILYTGYDQERFEKKNIPLTDLQKKQLKDYGNACHNGILKVGYKQEFIPAVRLEMVDDVMLSNYFSL